MPHTLHTFTRTWNVLTGAIQERTRIPFKIIALLFILHFTELKLITRPVTTTTPTPYVYTTAKPRRKQHQNHNHKSHDTSNRVKEILLPNNLQENEIVGAAAAAAAAGSGGGGGNGGGGGSIEGTYTNILHSYWCVWDFTQFNAIETIRSNRMANYYVFNTCINYGTQCVLYTVYPHKKRHTYKSLHTWEWGTVTITTLHRIFENSQYFRNMFSKILFKIQPFPPNTCDFDRCI